MQVMSRPLPMDIFKTNWEVLNDRQKNQAWEFAQLSASNRINKKGNKTETKILGYAESNLESDPRFDLQQRNHIKHGEALAQACLSSEFLVCDICHIHSNLVSKYIGRGQYPRFAYRKLNPNCAITERFVSHELNMWSDLLHRVDTLHVLLDRQPDVSIAQICFTNDSKASLFFTTMLRYVDIIVQLLNNTSKNTCMAFYSLMQMTLLIVFVLTSHSFTPIPRTKLL